MSEGVEPLERATFGAQELMARTPPRFVHPHKRAVFELACPPGTRHGGSLAYSRWAPMPLPERVDLGLAIRRVEAVPGFYDYAPVLPGAVEWHVNFADPHLFVAYGGGLFAQDEMQVLEHPALGALREALEAAGLPTVTVEDGRPTPVLVMGVERRCAVATDPGPERGRPFGLYGNRFAAAPLEVVLAATRVLDPPTITNLIAMAAPLPGWGRYTLEQIGYAASAAFTGFRAARLESARAAGEGVPVVVHTGFWGCGAFGGNRVLMVALQVLASGMAGLDRLVLHVGDPDGLPVVEEAGDALREAAGGADQASVAEVLDGLALAGFEWGVSDGN